MLVLGRIAARKGVEDVVAARAGSCTEQRSPVRLRIVGGPSLWSDYTPLLGDLPAENAEYAGLVAAAEVAGELRALRRAAAGKPLRAVRADGGRGARRRRAGRSARARWGRSRPSTVPCLCEVPVGRRPAMIAAIDELLGRAARGPCRHERPRARRGRAAVLARVVCAQIATRSPAWRVGRRNGARRARPARSASARRRPRARGRCARIRAPGAVRSGVPTTRSAPG